MTPKYELEKKLSIYFSTTKFHGGLYPGGSGPDTYRTASNPV